MGVHGGGAREAAHSGVVLVRRRERTVVAVRLAPRPGRDRQRDPRPSEDRGRALRSLPRSAPPRPAGLAPAAAEGARRPGPLVAGRPRAPALPRLRRLSRGGPL